jgi:type II secretory pathway component GspD/PulD (secretin)
MHGTRGPGHRKYLIAYLAVMAVWPGAGALAQAPPQRLRESSIGPRAVDVLQYVYLTDISHVDGKYEANLWDRYHHSFARLQPIPGLDQFTVDKSDPKPLKGKVISITDREVLFDVDGQHFGIHLGQNMADALAKLVDRVPEQDVAGKREGNEQEAQKGGDPIQMEWRQKPWGEVLEWLSDQSGLPVIASSKPTGTLSMSGSKTSYSLPEVVDILNEALTSHRLVLIRRDKSFIVVPADGAIDRTLVPSVRIEDLGGRGNSELVSVVLPLKAPVSEDVAQEVKKLLGPLGAVTAVGKANQLVLQDTAGNVKRIVQVLKESDAKAPATGRTKTVSMDVRDKPWSSVLQWLSEITGLPVISPSTPTGTLTFISPRKKDYTIAEVIDILNDVLATQSLLLIRGERSIHLVPADQRVEPGFIPRVSTEELSQRGQSELVSVVVVLRSAPAKELVPEIKKLLGPFGEVVALSNRLVIQGKAGNLQNIVRTIADIEAKSASEKPRVAK